MTGKKRPRVAPPVRPLAAGARLPLEIVFTVSLDPRTGTLHNLQRELRRQSRSAALSALALAIVEVEKMRPRCVPCGRPMRSRGRISRQIVTLFGTLRVRSRRYECPGCGAARRPVDQWLALPAGAHYTDAIREHALYLAADLSYEKAAEALLRIGGIAMSGREIQRLVAAESDRMAAALSGGTAGGRRPLGRRFRRAGRGGRSIGAQRILQLRRLKTAGLWDAYWANHQDQTI